MSKTFNISNIMKFLRYNTDEIYRYFSLRKLASLEVCDITSMPITMRIILESLLRKYDGTKITLEVIQKFSQRNKNSNINIPFIPARLILQDYTGVPLLVDLATLRDYVKKHGGNPAIVSMCLSTTLVVDHSLRADISGIENACALNEKREFKDNFERYHFLKWCQQAFRNFKIITPGHGIIHQINLEYLTDPLRYENGIVYPDSVIGTDSHTTMINGSGIIGWGVGGIEAEMLMLGLPSNLVIPNVIAVKLLGKLTGRASIMDLALSLTNKLRSLNVAGSIIEFIGEGTKYLSVFDRATIANLAPEIGILMGYFPIDEITLRFLKDRGNTQKQIDMIYSYYLDQGIYGQEHDNIIYDEIIEFDLRQVKPCIAGPNQPFAKINLDNYSAKVLGINCKRKNKGGIVKYINDGDILIAAITSCLATANPFLMVEAGLLAKKAAVKNLSPPKHVKTSFAPGSTMVSEYLKLLGLQQYLNKLGFNIIGYGCATCDGNYGKLSNIYEQALQKGNVGVSVLSGNRNFVGRVHPLIKHNFLMSPALVVAFALAGSIKNDIYIEPIGFDINKKPVFLQDIWPTKEEVKYLLAQIKWQKLFPKLVFQFDVVNERWRSLKSSAGDCYSWDKNSSYIAASPFFLDENKSVTNRLIKIENARAFLLLGDDITTDHISPVGKIMPFTLAGEYLREQGICVKDFNSFGSRRGNHHIMIRGAFSNLSLINFMVAGKEHGKTKHFPTQEIMPIYSVAMRYASEGVPLIIFAGDRYGAGSSRDWAAKATKLLGVKAVIAKSFERIHRNNLIGIGVLPLLFSEKDSWQSLNITGNEQLSILNLNNDCLSSVNFILEIIYSDGYIKRFPLISNLTSSELFSINSGGMLSYIKNFLINKLGGYKYE